MSGINEPVQLLAVYHVCILMQNSLNKSVALGSTRVHLVALEDDLLKLTIRLEDLLEVLLSHAEVNVADIETMEGGAVGTGSSTAF